MDPWLDRARARRAFDRAAPAGASADVVAREVERRMAERLDVMRLDPARILDAGCGPGAARNALRERYPRAELIALDFSLGMVRAARDAQPLIGRLRSMFSDAARRYVCADLARLPFAPASFGMVWSNLALAWTDPEAGIAEWARVLEPDGLLMFSSYGPDTLAEFRAAFATADTHPHVHPFVDMHDLGDMLAASGFATPVMDMEVLTLTYPGIDGLVRDLRRSGQTNALASRRRTLTGRQRWQRMAASYAARAAAGRLPATFEIVYGHAWKGRPRRIADGRDIIRLDGPARSRKIA